MDHYPFPLIPLKYPFDALRPYIDQETMRIHHNKHLKAYVDHLNQALSKYPAYQNYSLEYLINNTDILPQDIRTTVHNNAGGVYNHNLFFQLMKPNSEKKPVGTLAPAIDREFGSFARFKAEFKKAALGRFGSGWAWLVMDPYGRLKIISTANQDTPLPKGLCPILLIDVWEHAYYLLYQNRRGDYIDNWWNVVNWQKADENYLKCMERAGVPV